MTKYRIYLITKEYYIPIRRSKKVKVVAAIDSFKGSMTSLEVAAAFENGTIIYLNLREKNYG